MAYFTGPNIVKDGLIFALDAGSSRCFTSGDTTATDLVQGFNCSGANGNPGSGTHTPDPSNFPVYSSTKGGVFDFASGKGINVDGDLGNHTSSSISIWLYRLTSNGTQYIADARNDSGQWFLSNYQSYNINWHDALRYNFENPYNADATDFINKWVHVTVTSDSNVGSRIYINGVQKTAATTASADEDFGINFRIGTRYTTANQWTGKMGSIYLYNKVLSAAEVAQNFNAQQSRFL